ncbi:hypothetical protein ACQEVI_14715 [Promicromonospora sp. CA-289599]|uniref:hypothetical protein n=1 Tax=Promicromonospora sp. CA-289599 TaxID=3240014 RepID=UPI003D8AF7BE
MTSPDTVRTGRATHPYGPRRRRFADESGQAIPEYLGVIGVVLLVVAVVFVAVQPVGVTVGEKLICAVNSILPEDGDECVAGAPGGFGAPGGSPSGDPSGDPEDLPCAEKITVVDVTVEGKKRPRPVIQIDCVWYPVPTSCQEGDRPEIIDIGSEERSYDPEDVREIADCVIDGWGDTSDDPDDENCNKTMPTSEEISLHPPRVRSGCKWLPVPETVCDKEWEAYKDAAPGKERAARAEDLDTCVTDAYDAMETNCVVAAATHIEEQQTAFLFFRFSDSEAVVVEDLGDGRVRVHIVKGSGFGAGLSADEIFGSPVSFGVAALKGVTSDTTYEFVNMQDAQEWIDWKQEYDEVFNSTGQESCVTDRGQYCPGHDKRKERLEELAPQEPDHHIYQEIDIKTKKVKFNGGISGGAGGLEGGVEGGYEGEVTIEDRMNDDGTYEMSYSSTDIGGFLIGGALGGGKSFGGKGGKGDKGKGDKGDDGRETGGSGSAGAGGEWKGSTRTTVTFGPDGLLAQLYITIDDQALQTLYSAGIDVEAELPYGFTVGGGGSRTEQEGTSSAQEFIISFEQYPDLRDKFLPMVDKLFPRAPNGKLKKDDIEIDQSDQDDGGDLRDELEDHGNVRELTYDDTKTTTSGEFGVGWEGIDLFKNEWITADEERTLKESTLELTDADGNTVTVDPAPSCKHEAFEPDDDYYTNGKDKTGAGGSWGNPRYNEDDDGGPYPGTDFNGDVPGNRSEKSKSLVVEYRKAFPDKNIIVIHEDIGLDFGPDVKGKEHLAKVGDFYVIGVDSGTVRREGDGGFLNWSFDPTNAERPGDEDVVKFTSKNPEEEE